jgi:hypothetical protein
MESTVLQVTPAVCFAGSTLKLDQATAGAAGVLFRKRHASIRITAPLPCAQDSYLTFNSHTQLMSGVVNFLTGFAALL